MVCFMTPTIVNNSQTENNNMDVDHNKSVDESSVDDRLRLKRIAGGSIIKYPPLFSPDSESLFIIFKNVVQVYSTTTGEWLKDLKGSSDDIVGIHYEIGNPKILIGCTRRGEIIRWKVKSGAVDNKVQLSQWKDSWILTFHLVDIWSNSPCALITYKPNKESTSWSIIDITTGKSLNVPLTLYLKDLPCLVSVENKYFHYFAMTQGNVLYVVNYKTWKAQRWYGAKRALITYLQVHPKEEMLITGDELGKIFLWRQLWADNQPYTTLYHWHHTAITSICFTETGSGFYSGGLESVLVKWNIDNPDMKNFLPRFQAIIQHIAVSPGNTNVAVCTSDNGIQILNSQNKAKCVIQNFTYVYDNKTNLDKFPVGVQLNARKNCLVLNGRTGYLQFYSTYTKSLLYNMDIVQQNCLSMEANKILYDIRVTCAAFNVDWMATAEVWDDQEHDPELRLKFWQYQKENQSYTLNTSIELPHERGIQAIEFSSKLDSDNLVCATLGNDNVIKIWSLEDSENIYKKGKIWYCVSETKYKNFPIESINFSQDGSLLAAGYGNNLCIYKADTLKVKVVLTPPAALDGSLQKIQLRLHKEQLNGGAKGPENENVIKRKKVIELFKSLLENNEEQLFSEIKKNVKTKQKAFIQMPSTDNLSTKQQEFLFKKILYNTELNLFQKIDIYQKLEIYCTVPNESKDKLHEYIASTILKAKDAEKHSTFLAHDLPMRHRFKAKCRLHKYMTRKRYYKSKVNNQLVPLLDLLCLNQNPKNKLRKREKDVSICNGFKEDRDGVEPTLNKTDILSPLQNVACIKHVAFAAEEFAHLVVICTERRILIWNLLTLKIQCILKLSVHKIVVDPISSLFAAFTTTNELYVFLPNCPMPIYRRFNMPYVHGACWVPRRYPKSQSINLDWQSMSTLYFLTNEQELMVLAAENDIETGEAIVTYLGDSHEPAKYSTFGAFATKQISDRRSANSKTNYSSTGIGVPGKVSIKELVQMGAHTMAPVNLLCKNFLKSFLIADEKKSTKPSTYSSKSYQIPIREERDSDDEFYEFERKKINLRNAVVNKLSKEATSKSTDVVTEDEKLQQILSEKIKLEF